MTDNDIIFGKQPTERIVSVEVAEDKTELFIQQPNGDVSSQFVPNKYWILSNTPHSNEWIKLHGKNHYQYGLTFTDLDDWNYTRKFLKYKKNADIFSVYNVKEQFLIKNGYTYFKGLKHNEVGILSFDLETNGLHRNSESRVFLISNTFRKNGIITKKLFSYDDYADEGEMIVAWAEWVNKCDPSILSGYNIVLYDLPYLQHVAELNEVSIDIGRNGSSLKFETFESKLRKDQTQHINYFKPIVYGREVIDVYFLALKTDQIFKRWSSLSLKTVVKEEGLEVPGRTFYDASSIRFNYKDPIEWKKIKDYCRDDSDDSLNLYDRLCAPYFYSTRSVPKSYQGVIESASGSQINSMLVRAYLQFGVSIPKADDIKEFQGALSAGIPGIYSNCFKIDLISLYPSIIRQFRIFNKTKDPEGYFLRMADYFTEERVKNKNLYKTTKNIYYDHLQNTQKTFANSLYGFLSSHGLNFNSPVDAALVTKKGREILEYTIEWATGKSYAKWNL